MEIHVRKYINIVASPGVLAVYISRLALDTAVYGCYYFGVNLPLFFCINHILFNKVVQIELSEFIQSSDFNYGYLLPHATLI